MFIYGGGSTVFLRLAEEPAGPLRRGRECAHALRPWLRQNDSPGAPIPHGAQASRDRGSVGGMGDPRTGPLLAQHGPQN